MAAIWWVQLSLVVLVSKYATGTRPYFTCEGSGSWFDNCDGIGIYRDMYGFKIAEANELNKILYTLEAYDPDDESSLVTIEMLPYTGTLLPYQANGYDYLSVNSFESMGNVTTKAALDYETVHELWFKWLLTDEADETYVKTIKVVITDVNDNKPEFTSLPYRLDAIEEGTKSPGETIFTVNATDRDTKENIKFDIVKTHLGWPCNGDMIFQINPSTGAISLKAEKTLDFETSTLYTICVSANDSGAPVGGSLYNYAQVIVAIQDVQDEPPYFTITNYDREISEDAPVGSDVLKVNAREGDRGVLVPNLILYSLTRGDGKFEIDNTTGQITIREALDRENNVSHIVTVVAQEIRANGTYGPWPSSAEVNITIQVGDADDENATFSAHMVDIELTENTLQGSFVPLDGLTVKDIDQAPNNRFYLRLGGPDADVFVIANEGAEITGDATVDVRVHNGTKLDFEENQFLEFEIYATDVGSNQYDVAYVHVNVTDQNDETPTFSQEKYSFTVKENSEREKVGLVNATDRDSEPYSQVTYELFGQGDKPKFSMSRTTGEIRTLDKPGLDYEFQTVYFFTCVASDGQRSGTTIVQINLVDQNDNAPEFSSQFYTTQVEENDIPDAPLLTVSANDGDRSETNNNITFTLWNNTYSDSFNIMSTNGKGVIKLTQKLDFEKDGAAIDLVVIATDNGEPQQSANATVRVTIQDMNDQSPIFTKKVYDGDVQEGATRGVFVLRVNATDDDKQDTVNSRIDYFFVDETVSKFRIVIRTGEVNVNSADLDRDESGFYDLEVIAIDRGEPPKNGTCHVKITILDINNKPPIFNNINPTVDIPEGALSDSLVANMTATDRDETALLSYGMDEDKSKAFDMYGKEVTSVNVTDIFCVDYSTGAVYLQDSRLNREKTARFEIAITVVDLNGTPTQKAETTLTVKVLDINDNAPKFLKDGYYYYTVVENTAVGSIIANDIVAEDKDEGDNAKIRYELVDDVDSLMRIHPKTGILFVNGTFDREKYPNYTVRVAAYDSGSPKLSSNETIVITIVDVNDNGPEFDENLNGTVEIPENFTNGMVILQVVANDRDESVEFGSVVYKITAGDPEGIFTIDTEGFIMIRDGKKLDRETKDTHILTITASDREKQDTMEVTIEVSDINDMPPVFTSSNKNVTLQESVEIGQLVTTLTATDSDQPNTNNSKVEYHITAGNDEDLFVINTEILEGIITTKRSLSNRVGTYRLSVVAMDAGTPPLHSEPFTVTVTVTDVNDDTPEITSPQNLEVFYIPENYTGFVLEVKASDTDEGANGEVNFSFVKSAGETGRDDEYFNMVRVDPDNKQHKARISIKTKTDRETKDTYYLEVEVKDNGIAPLAATVSFTVRVNDTDDNEPLFWTDPDNKPNAAFTVFENDDTVVMGSVDLASDADEPQNQHIYYFIVDGNANDQANGTFVLNKTTGVLSLQKPLDREQNQTLKLVIMVNSNADFIPSAAIPYDENDKTLLEVTVTVRDRNDNGPVFYVKDKLYTGGVKYNAEFNSEVIKVEAIDNDVGDFAIVVYGITSQKYTSTDGSERDDNAFGIIRETGSVVTAKVFEKGDAGYYTIIVKAEDSLNAAFSDQATVSIYLYSEDQQVKMTIFKSTDVVRGYQDNFKQTIEEIILKYGVLSSSLSVKRASDTVTPVVVIDDIQVLVVNGQPNADWSDLRFHVVNQDDNTIIVPKVIVDAIDDAYDYTEIIRGEYGVDEIVIAIPPTVPPPDLTWIQWLLVGILCASVVLAIGLVATICIMTSGYKRKLRAATAGIYEPLSSAANANHAPNTNKFTEPGSNPVFNAKISNEFDKSYVELAEAATIDNKEKKISNGHAKQIPTDSNSVEAQEMVVDMFDDSLDYDVVGDNETGDRLLLQVLADYEKDKQEGLINLPEFANLTITEI